MCDKGNDCACVFIGFRNFSECGISIFSFYQYPLCVMQVMYMYYALEWKLLASNNGQETAENTYLLALDGDVDFEPEAVLSLMRRMKKSPMVGAACGRIHPIGSGNRNNINANFELDERIYTPVFCIIRPPVPPPLHLVLNQKQNDIMCVTVVNTVVSNHVNSDHVPSFSCLDV